MAPKARCKPVLIRVNRYQIGLCCHFRSSLNNGHGQTARRSRLSTRKEVTIRHSRPTRLLRRCRASPCGPEGHNVWGSWIIELEFTIGQQSDRPFLMGNGRDIRVSAGGKVDHHHLGIFVNRVCSVIRYAGCYDTLCFVGVALARSLAAIFGISARDRKSEKWPSCEKMITPFGDGPKGSPLLPSSISLVTATRVHAPTNLFLRGFLLSKCDARRARPRRWRG
jgi:hypothetical protein